MLEVSELKLEGEQRVESARRNLLRRETLDLPLELYAADPGVKFARRILINAVDEMFVWQIDVLLVAQTLPMKSPWLAAAVRSSFAAPSR